MASAGGKRVLKVAKEAQPYRTELTPVAFLRRSAYVFGERTAIVHGARRGNHHHFVMPERTSAVPECQLSRQPCETMFIS